MLLSPCLNAARKSGLGAVCRYGALAGLLTLAACASAPKQGGEQKPPAGQEAAATASVVMPQEVRERFNEAMQAVAAGDNEKGAALLKEVVSKSQNNAVPWISLAQVQVRLGQLQEAEASLKSALAISPLHPVASNELGLLYRKTGRFEEARKVYEAVLQKYPEFPLANRNLGILCDLYLRDYACALKAYEAFSKAEPDDKSAKMWVADMQKRVGGVK
jgi:Flp pilus assembly protein TadD